MMSKKIKYKLLFISVLLVSIGLTVDTWNSSMSFLSDIFPPVLVSPSVADSIEYGNDYAIYVAEDGFDNVKAFPRAGDIPGLKIWQTIDDENLNIYVFHEGDRRYQSLVKEDVINLGDRLVFVFSRGEKELVVDHLLSGYVESDREDILYSYDENTGITHISINKLRLAPNKRFWIKSDNGIMVDIRMEKEDDSFSLTGGPVLVSFR